MSKDKISDYSATANSNTDIAGINIDEGCAPSGINNAIRTLMKQIKDLYAGTSGDKWPVASGGTGATSASDARTNLGLAIGTDVQAYSTELAAISASGNAMFKNRIINGAMTIDQRNAGSSVTPTANQYLVDRWYFYGSQTSKVTVQQNAGAVTPPIGFTKYLGITSTSAYSVTSTDQFVISQRIEGFNTADLSFGSASASTVTLSFWVRSSLTGAFGGSLQNATLNRCYPFSYTINSANTWELKTISIAGDNTGTWLSDNGVGLIVNMNLGTGSTYSSTTGAWTGTSYITAPTGATSVVGTNGATFYITGVQLEKGSTATSFDYRPYGTELGLCQRYYEIGTWNMAPANSGNFGVWYRQSFKMTKRASPTATTTVVNGSSYTSVGVSADANEIQPGYTATGGGSYLQVTWTASAEL